VVDEQRTIRYDVLECSKCEYRWWITDSEAPPMHSLTSSATACSHDWVGINTFFAKYNGPGLALTQVTNRVTCPNCAGVGRLYDQDEVGEPCPMCREDGYIEIPAPD
jgi:hypothetical protein